MTKKKVQKTNQTELWVKVILTLVIVSVMIYIWVNRPKPVTDKQAVVTDQTTANVAEGLVGEPTVYAATLPCSDCPAIDVTLELYPNGQFNEVFVRQEAEQETPSSDGGDWKIVSDLFGRSGESFLVLSSNCRGEDVYFVQTELGFLELESDGSERNVRIALDFQPI